MPAPLPIDDLLTDIVDSLRAKSNVVLEAPPGAGKTTRVPQALLDLGPREVLVLEPRRIAAKLLRKRNFSGVYTMIASGAASIIIR